MALLGSSAVQGSGHSGGWEAWHQADNAAHNCAALMLVVPPGHWNGSPGSLLQKSVVVTAAGKLHIH